jgi:hypothetical protein
MRSERGGGQIAHHGDRLAVGVRSQADAVHADLAAGQRGNRVDARDSWSVESWLCF